MSLSSTGLTGSGLTANFQIQYETTLPNQANVIANANSLLAVVENEFTVTTGWFNTPPGKFGSGNRQVVNLNLADTPTTFPGANNSGYGNAINIDAQNLTGNGALAAGRVEMVWMNEWSEVLMSLTNGAWNAGDSSGEGLSQYSGIVRFPTGHYNYYSSWVEAWLNQTPRQDWVTKTEATDKNQISFGCALAFIYYLNVQLNFTINQIIAAGASNLATVYSTLTGDPGNPFSAFSALLEHVYPSSATASIPGPITDNPFPIAIVQFWANKDTFGKDEVQEVIKKKSGLWSEAFWLVVDGFSKSSFDALGVTVSALTGSFANLSGVTISQNPDVDYENAADALAPQRIRIPFDVTFTNASLSDFPGSGNALFGLAAFLAIGGTKVTGSDAATQFELVAGADPYFTNVDTTPNDPNRNNVFYLSQDLRVFTATPGQNNTPVPGAPAFGSDDVPGAFGYIKGLLTWLNQNYSDPNGVDPFTTVLPGQDAALKDDSSVTPLTVDFSNIFNIKIYNNYNFAVARVRLTGTAGPAGAAPNARVFFRLWCTQTPDTDYQIGSTYPSILDGANLPSSPLVGTDHVTIPFFASGNLAGNTDYGAGGANTRDIQIATGKDAIWAYYGCFLNLYDQTNVIDGKPVQGWLTGTHHCLVAQIAEDQAPVIPGASPAASDKLAQRNLQVTLSDNPGPPATHRIPQTFDIRPSAGGQATPDELMIDWGAVPQGSLASIYWPQVLASDVLALASSLYSTHTLSAADNHTIQCKVTGGVTYIPIPAGSGENFAGLFTVDLPPTLVAGQEFNIIVRRVSIRQFQAFGVRTNTLPSTVDLAVLKGQGLRNRRAKAERVVPAMTAPPRTASWRRVIGTFAVKIPVTTAQTMLWPEENTLAIMRWRLHQMAPSSRWRPVLERYIGLVAGRVDGLGGVSSSILPSPTGVPVKTAGKDADHLYTGKVCEVLFDCFGDFEGFVLNDCGDAHRFYSRQRGIEALVLRACKEQLRIVITVDPECESRICKLAVTC